MKTKFNLAMTGLLIPLALTACGGGGGGGGGGEGGAGATNTETTPILQGRFIDSAVKGLTYTTQTQEGTTDSEGQYNYRTGETITFSINKVVLPSIPAVAVTTPQSYSQTPGVNDTTTINLASFLQNLDENRDLTDGIDIESIAEELLSDQDLTSLDFANDQNFDLQVGNIIEESNFLDHLITKQSAENHLNESLADIEAERCSTHPMVGFTTTLGAPINRRVTHEVQGTATIMDDCTIEITNFSYDGGGFGSVFIYGGVNRDFADGIQLGNNLKDAGEGISNVTLEITLEPEDLDNLNSLSVWCVEAKSSFGEGLFRP